MALLSAKQLDGKIRTDPVAVDAVGAAVMGISPTDVKHLLLAEKKTSDLKRIEIIGELIEKAKRRFHRPSSGEGIFF